MMEETKRTIITIISSLLLFSFILFLVYVIYCYAYYDVNKEEEYAGKILEEEYDFIYEHMVVDGLSKDEFRSSINLMYDKSKLKDIYYLYYGEGEYESIDEFLKTYYYGDRGVDRDDIEFIGDGKTSLFKRRKLYYKSIKVTNKNGLESSLGVKYNVNLKIEDGAVLKIDEDTLSCQDNSCVLDKVFGGIYEVSYESNGYSYYGLLNILDDNMVVEITNLDSLVKVSKNKTSDEISIRESVLTGVYALEECYLESGCPVKSKSYLKIMEDNKVIQYTYISLDNAGDYYEGTYEITGNFLVMNFDSHVYRMFDYDTKERTDIVGNGNITLQYQIIDEKTIYNEKYKFVWQEPLEVEEEEKLDE